MIISKKDSRISVLIVILVTAVFLWSCGLPQAPFYVDTDLSVDDSNIQSDQIDFSIQFDDIYDANGISLYFTYSNTDISSNGTGEGTSLALKLDSALFYNGEELTGSSGSDYSFYSYISNEDAESLPTYELTTILQNLDLINKDKLYVRLLLESTPDGNYTLSIILYSDNYYNVIASTTKKLYRYSETNMNPIGSYTDDIMPVELDVALGETTTENTYHVHIFGTYYAQTDDTQVNNSIAITDGSYLGYFTFNDD